MGKQQEAAVTNHDAVLKKVTTAIGHELEPNRAMQAVVRLLEAEVPDYAWVGIYLLDGNELVLGPFLGKPSPHTRIPLGRGICGAAAAEKATIIVDDVHSDPRYLACSVDTKSEIVVPIMRGNDVLGEIDIDSDRPAAFGKADQKMLESMAALLADRISQDQ
jgi:L-methionine (R)-S-oxide reductase